MKFKLKTETKVRYSKGELAAFKALSDKARSSTIIVDKVYAKDVPYNGRKIVICMLNSLRRKMAVNKEPFKIQSTERNGPNPIEFWLEGK